MKPDIEFTDLPLPSGKTPRRPWRFPFDRLEVGKCFIIKGIRNVGISPYIAYASKTLNRKFTTRTNKDGVVVWRTE